MTYALVLAVPTFLLLGLAIYKKRIWTLILAGVVIVHAAGFAFTLVNLDDKQKVTNDRPRSVHMEIPAATFTKDSPSDNLGIETPRLKNSIVGKFNGNVMAMGEPSLIVDSIERTDFDTVTNTIQDRVSLEKLISDQCVKLDLKSGDLVFSLVLYGACKSDIDIHITAPDGVKTWWRNKAAGSGELDNDRNIRATGASDRSIENVVFSTPKRGVYKIGVDAYTARSRGKPVRFMVVVRSHDKVLKRYEDIVVFDPQRGPNYPEWNQSFRF